MPMLSEDKVIALYCPKDPASIVGDILKVMRHRENSRVRVSESEVITTAFVALLYFGGHLNNAPHFMQMQGYVPQMLDKSRFCRRLNRLSDFLLLFSKTLGALFKDLASVATYRLDSFPIAVCEIISISRSRILRGEVFRGKHVSMHRFLYGVRV